MNELDEHLEAVHGARLRSLSPSVPSGWEVERMAAKAHRIADSGIRSTTGTWQVAVALVVAVVALGLATTLIPGNRAPIAEPAGTAGTSDSSVRPEGTDATHGVLDGSGYSSRGIPMIGPLQDPNVPGISLEEVFARIGRKIPLPQSEESTVSKAVYFAAPDGSSNFELALLYSSGFELRVIPGEHDLDRFAQSMASVPFRDGKNHLGRQPVGTREVVLISGGVQAGAADGHRVRAVALWNEAGLAYTLYCPDDGTGDVERLIDMVSTVR